VPQRRSNQSGGPGKPASAFLFAIPVPSPSLELHRLVTDNFVEFGNSGGLAVWWRPIASTTLADPIYKKLRSPEMIRRDRNDARKYLHYCEKAGGEDNYVRCEYWRLARRYNIGELERPMLILVPTPDSGAVATLALAPNAFETAERRRTLAWFLEQELSASRLINFSLDGTFDAESIQGLQGHADAVAKMVAEYIAMGRPISDRKWNTHLVQNGLGDRPDPGVHTKAVAWRRGDAIHFRCETDGIEDGELVFPFHEAGISKQLHLMWWLLLKWPHGLTFKEIAEELYMVEYREAVKSGDRDMLAKVAKCVRALIHDIRTTRLTPAGMNAEILPTIMKTRDRSSSVRLRLAGLDRTRLGHLAGKRII